MGLAIVSNLALVPCHSVSFSMKWGKPRQKTGRIPSAIKITPFPILGLVIIETINTKNETKLFQKIFVMLVIIAVL